MCLVIEEDFEHFMTCQCYGPTDIEIVYTEIFDNNPEYQYHVAMEIKRRIKIRKHKLDEVGLPQTLASLLQDTVELQLLITLVEVNLVVIIFS